MAKKESKLLTLIKGDSELNKDKAKRAAFIAMAEHYTSDLENTIFQTPFELVDEVDGTTIDEWTEFLKNPAVTKYRTEILNLYTKAQQQKDIAQGIKSKDALAVVEAIERQEGTGEKHNYVVMMMPPRKKYESN